MGRAKADVIVGFQVVVTSIPVLFPSRPYLQAGVKKEVVVMEERENRKSVGTEGEIAQIWAQGISTKVRRTTFVFGHILCSNARAFYTKYPQTRRLDFVTYTLIPRVGFAKNRLAKNAQTCV